MTDAAPKYDDLNLLHVTLEDGGQRRIVWPSTEFRYGQDREVTVNFSETASLEVSIEGYDGSGYEGELNADLNGAGSAPTQAKSQHYFVAGIGQKKDINAAEVCGGVDKVQKVEVQQTFLNGLLSVVTFSIYTPRMARVYCGE